MSNAAEKSSAPNLQWLVLDSCPLCQSSNLHKARSEEVKLPESVILFESRDISVDISECDDCGFAFVDKLPDGPEFYDQLYAHATYQWDLEFKHHGKFQIQRDIRRQLTRYKSAGRLLDVGCWVGAFINSVKDIYDVHGLELNIGASGHGKSQGLDIQNVMFQDFEAEPFDIITFVDVLEHLPEPGKIVEKAKSLLNPGGLLYIKVPNYKGQAYKQDVLQRMGLTKDGIAGPYVHINHFSRESLSKHLNDHGFEVLEHGNTFTELWDLSVDVPLGVKAKRFVRNMVQTVVTMSVNTLAHGIPGGHGLNLYVLAQKK